MSLLILLTARALYGGFFLTAAIDQFGHLHRVTPYLYSTTPAATKFVTLQIALECAVVALSVLLGIAPTIGAIVAWALLFGMLSWAPVSLSGDKRRHDVVELWKNAILGSGALLFALLPRPWPWSIGF